MEPRVECASDEVGVARRGIRNHPCLHVIPLEKSSRGAVRCGSDRLTDLPGNSRSRIGDSNHIDDVHRGKRLGVKGSDPSNAHDSQS